MHFQTEVIAFTKNALLWLQASCVCSVKGVFQSLNISPASVHDIHYLKDIKQQMKDCTTPRRQGYLSADYQLDLFTSHNIRLEVPMRKNQKTIKINLI